MTGQTQPELMRAHQVEGQARILLEHFFNLVRAGLFAHLVDQLNDAGLGRREQLGLDQGRAGKPVALEQPRPGWTPCRTAGRLTFSAISSALLWRPAGLISAASWSGASTDKSSLMSIRRANQGRTPTAAPCG